MIFLLCADVILLTCMTGGATMLPFESELYPANDSNLGYVLQLATRAGNRNPVANSDKNSTISFLYLL